MTRFVEVAHHVRVANGIRMSLISLQKHPLMRRLLICEYLLAGCLIGANVTANMLDMPTCETSLNGPHPQICQASQNQ